MPLGMRSFHVWTGAVAITAMIATAAAAPDASGAAPPFERTEERAACRDHDPLRRPMFGDLHVHSSYSFDSYTSGQRNDPWAAYRYAKGEPITLPDAYGNPTVEAQIRRPLDFASVTDHAEFLGEIGVCTEDPWSVGYWSPLCILTRSEYFYLQLTAAGMWVDNGVADDATEKTRSYICDLPGNSCSGAAARRWSAIQRAAEEHYDRSADCRFTTFVGYEYTDAPSFKNLHRNVIFRNDRVTETPVNTFDTGARNYPELWRRLRSECIDRDDGCDVLAIPHNPNLSGGLMFPDPQNEQEARDRLFFEPIAELVQHKAASECRFDRLADAGLDTADELCTFEQNRTDNLSTLGVLFGERQVEENAPVPLGRYGRRNMLRNVLKDGLALERSSGTNPFRMGFIGSTDTHSATPGGAMEDGYVGHLGRRDSGHRNVQDHFEDNPGGHAVVWAEENSRDAIFAGMRRRETYATSGTRITVRFFGGWDYPEDLCDRPDLVQAGYDAGVPMGGELRGAPQSAPRFVVSALRDPGTPTWDGTDLERVQIIKGWVDADGRTHERVFDVAGRVGDASTLDPATCEQRGSGAPSLCRVWEDPEFDPALPAFYYARVLELPTCRWSALQCQAAGVNPFSPDCAQQATDATAREQDQGAQGDVWGKCCTDEATEPFYSPVIRERAWTSPIWYRPG